MCSLNWLGRLLSHLLGGIVAEENVDGLLSRIGEGLNICEMKLGLV